MSLKRLSTTRLTNNVNKRIQTRRSTSASASASQQQQHVGLALALGSNDNDNIDLSSQEKESPKRTQSFDAIWAGNVHQGRPSISDSDSTHNMKQLPKVHTLILGTHPSITSLSKHQYFGHVQNSFFWIAGDCLGFCRDVPISPKTNEPYAFASKLRYYNSNDNNHNNHNNQEEDKHNKNSSSTILTYDQQLERLTQNGFALWDLIQSCEREGSLDCNIEEEKANDILSFCQQHETIRRIVFANGLGQCKLFLKHFKEWWDCDCADNDNHYIADETLPLLVPANNDLSRKAFGKRYSKRIDMEVDQNRRTIECVCMLGVSPANARFTYEEKRDYWERYCYVPALADHAKLREDIL